MEIELTIALGVPDNVAYTQQVCEGCRVEYTQVSTGYSFVNGRKYM